MNHAKFANRAGCRHQQGVGLIEVLVAVLVVSVGFLGVAALQVTSLSTNNSAMARSMATVASYSILDAMRVDRTNAIAGNYDGTVTGNACPAIPATVTLSGTQLNHWCNQLANDLGAANTTTGNIACVGNNCTVTIQFDDSRSGNDGGVDKTTGLTTVVTKAAL